MSSLTLIEKRRFEALLGMSTGYVLNYSNRTFGEFVSESTGKDIFDPRYEGKGTSKANRLRAFWELENDAVVGKLMKDILDDSEMKGDKVDLCKAAVERLLGRQATQSQPAPQTNAPNPPSPPLAIDSKHYDLLSRAMNELLKMAPQPRGFAFERFLNDAFSTFGLSPRGAFRLTGQQIDGSFHLTNETYLVEAKWQDERIGNRELQSFAGTVRTKSSWARGLYVSYSGFSDEGLIAFSQGDATRIICIDGLELWNIFTHRLNLADVLSLKTRRAAETGRAHCPLRELYPNHSAF